MKTNIIIAITLFSGISLADKPFRVSWTLDNPADSIALDKDEYSFKAEQNVSCVVTKVVRDYIPDSGQGITEVRVLNCSAGKKKLLAEVFCTRNQTASSGSLKIGASEYKLNCQTE